MSVNREMVNGVKIKPTGKWHRLDIFESGVTVCGLKIPSTAHRNVKFSIRVVTSEPGWIPKQKCVKCFSYNAVDYVIDSLSLESARSVSSINGNCYKDSYIYQILYRLVQKKMAHICCLDGKTGTNLYRLGDKSSCPLKEKWHSEKDANIAWMEYMVNKPSFWLRPAIANPPSLRPAEAGI